MGKMKGGDFTILVNAAIAIAEVVKEIIKANSCSKNKEIERLRREVETLKKKMNKRCRLNDEFDDIDEELLENMSLKEAIKELIKDMFDDPF